MHALRVSFNSGAKMDFDDSQMDIDAITRRITHPGCRVKDT